MRVSRVLALGIAALLVAGACGGTTPAASSAPTVAASVAPTATPTPIKIKSSYGNVTPANLAPFMAKELGLFEKRGLDVDLSLIDGGAPSAAALVSGQTQVGNFGGTEAMSGFVAGSDMQVIALFVPVTPWQFLAKSDYKTPADLKGKVVGVASVGGSAYVAATESLKRLGLDPAKDVTIQAFGSTANLATAMLGGAAYAGPGHPPDTVKLLAGGFKVIYDLGAQQIPATDNCTTSPTKTASTVGTCSATVTVTATDECGNSGSVTYSTRIDNTNPLVTKTSGLEPPGLRSSSVGPGLICQLVPVVLDSCAQTASTQPCSCGVSGKTGPRSAPCS